MDTASPTCERVSTIVTLDRHRKVVAGTPEHVYRALVGFDYLAKRELLPGEHLVDTAYATTEQLVSRRDDHIVDLVGPVGAD